MSKLVSKKNNKYNFIIKLLIYFYYDIFIFLKSIFGDWGLGIGDWGLGIGDWAQSPIPKPQSPIPNPHSQFLIIRFK